MSNGGLEHYALRDRFDVACDCSEISEFHNKGVVIEPEEAAAHDWRAIQDKARRNLYLQVALIRVADVALDKGLPVEFRIFEAGHALFTIERGLQLCRDAMNHTKNEHFVKDKSRFFGICQSILFFIVYDDLKECVSVIEERRSVLEWLIHRKGGNRTVQDQPIRKLVYHRQEDAHEGSQEEHQSSELGLMGLISVEVELHRNAEKVKLGYPLVLSHFLN